VLVMAALAICAITAALVKDRTDTQAPPRSGPISRHPPSPAWTRRHQARSRWFHKRTRLARDAAPSLVS
jgi:hypothetical protein